MQLGCRVVVNGSRRPAAAPHLADLQLPAIRFARCFQPPPTRQDAGSIIEVRGWVVAAHGRISATTHQAAAVIYGGDVSVIVRCGVRTTDDSIPISGRAEADAVRRRVCTRSGTRNGAGERKAAAIVVGGERLIVGPADDRAAANAAVGNDVSRSSVVVRDQVHASRIPMRARPGNSRTRVVVERSRVGAPPVRARAVVDVGSSAKVVRRQVGAPRDRHDARAVIVRGFDVEIECVRKRTAGQKAANIDHRQHVEIERTAVRATLRGR